MNSPSAISDLIKYYNTIHPENLDLCLIQEQVLKLRNDLGSCHKLSVREDYVLRYLSCLYEYYRNQTEIKFDFMEEGIDLGHVNTISHAASLISFGVHGFSDRHQKILSGCSEILNLDHAYAKNGLFDILINDCDRGDYLSASEIISNHNYTGFDIRSFDSRPSGFCFGNQHIADRVFSIPEWINIARFFELHADALKEQQDTGKAINYSQCLNVGNYRLYVVKYPDVAHITIRLTGVVIFQKRISDEEELMEFRLLINGLKEFISDIESFASHTFSDPSLFLSNCSPKITHL